MESYGAILRQAREEKKISIETASIETSISRQYIEALENETTAAFHGEAYLVGFLRNYADYLNVDSQKLVNLYRNVLIQESEVPQGLYERPKPAYLVPLIITGVFLLIVACFVIFYFVVYKPKQAEKDLAATVTEKVQQNIYELTDRPMNERVYVGDQIIVPSTEGNITLTVKSDTESRLGLETPVGLQYFDLSETRDFDVNGDGTADLVIDVWEISANKNSRGAEVYIMLKDESMAGMLMDATSIPVADKDSVVQTTILEDNRAYPFTMNASFRNPCVFRYLVDRKDSVENYYTNGDVVTMTANNKVRIWISNGNTVKFQIIAASQTYELEIGKAGEVMVEDIKWIRTEDGKYRLVVENLD